MSIVANNNKVGAILPDSVAPSSWGEITGQITNQTDLQGQFGTKQDIISDLSTIRQGALNGTSALNQLVNYETTAQAAITRQTLEQSIATKQPLIDSTHKLDHNLVDGLQQVAWTGFYSDLTGKPTKVSDFTNDTGFITASDTSVTNKVLKAGDTMTGTLTVPTIQMNSAPSSFTSTSYGIRVSASSLQSSFALQPIINGTTDRLWYLYAPDNNAQVLRLGLRNGSTNKAYGTIQFGDTTTGGMTWTLPTTSGTFALLENLVATNVSYTNASKPTYTNVSSALDQLFIDATKVSGTHDEDTWKTITISDDTFSIPEQKQDTGDTATFGEDDILQFTQGPEAAIEPNPSAYATDSLRKLRIDDTIYSVGGSATTIASTTIGTTWTGTGPYTQVITIPSAQIDEYSMIDLLPDATQFSQMIADGVTAMYVENTDGVLTLTAVGGYTTQSMTMGVSITQVSEVIE